MTDSYRLHAHRRRVPSPLPASRGEVMERLWGHTLVANGAPHYTDGQRKLALRRSGGFGILATGGYGCAKCSCGALSDVLTSGLARRRWHRSHKSDILTAEADQ